MIDIGLNIIIIIILIVYFMISLIKKISFKVSFVVSIIYFALAFLFLLFENYDLVINISAVAYYILIVSIALAVVEYFREIRKTKKDDKPKINIFFLKDIDEIKKK